METLIILLKKKKHPPFFNIFFKKKKKHIIINFSIQKYIIDLLTIMLVIINIYYSYKI